MTEPTDRRLAELAESFALTMAQSGMQKATARVLAALLFSSDETMTAGELGEQLQLSSGSVSGAIKQLTPIGLIERVPAPGSRRDHFRVRSGAWATLMGGQNAMFHVMQHAARDGIDIAGADSVTGRRLDEMHDFYRYMATELPALIDRWHRQYHGGAS
ncbi:hypothetical protein Athai_39300 [Actinocatenispora thailandica]|uniref:HTH marR-type domain-containing protein n=1 Tax=Actinocatenispora thailandica TaxID=227318 RepID=A0A7R7HXQ3_9ACTN|nr:MarR family transcriptional regulator [Actinocatenispora thailandica]BCJ36427.1 hypothetical protein Athai_39300 [Actinocatenispora thailandica]